MAVLQRLKSFFAKPGSTYFVIAGAWGAAAVPCLCPACLAGPAIFLGRGIAEHIQFLKKRMGD